jgi:hypothetical protein
MFHDSNGRSAQKPNLLARNNKNLIILEDRKKLLAQLKEIIEFDKIADLDK